MEGKECQEHKRTYSHRQWLSLSDASRLVGRMFDYLCPIIANSNSHHLSRTFPGLDALCVLLCLIVLTLLKE